MLVYQKSEMKQVVVCWQLEVGQTVSAYIDQSQLMESYFQLLLVLSLCLCKTGVGEQCYAELWQLRSTAQHSSTCSNSDF